MLFAYSAGAFIYRKEKGKLFFLFLVKENGEYDIPKGHIEKGESSEVAAKREIKEESGIDAKFLPFFSMSDRYFYMEKKQKVLKQVRVFMAEAGSSSVRISHEHKGHEWMTYDEAMKRVTYKSMKQRLTKANEYVKRYGAMKEINEEYSRLPNTTKSWELSRRFVPGEGRLDAEVMLIGQAPGDNEDKMGRPFVGRSGRLLDSLLKKAKIKRNDTYITSVVQFFPPKNRLPTGAEAEMCRPFLEKQISIIKPRFVILLGNFACEALLGFKEVEKNHGKAAEKDGIKYLITFHPAAALRFKEKVGLMLNDLKAFRSIISRSG